MNSNKTSEALEALSRAGGEESIKPKRLGLEIITPGDKNHKHKFEEINWDPNRLGPSVIDFDKDNGERIAFPKATFQDLLICSCGCEAIKKTRALI